MIWGLFYVGYNLYWVFLFLNSRNICYWLFVGVYKVIVEYDCFDRCGLGSLVDDWLLFKVNVI